MDTQRLGNVAWIACTVRLSEALVIRHQLEGMGPVTNREMTLPGHLMGFTNYGDGDGCESYVCICLSNGIVVECDPQKMRITDPTLLGKIPREDTK